MLPLEQCAVHSFVLRIQTRGALINMAKLWSRPVTGATTTSLLRDAGRLTALNSTRVFRSSATLRTSLLLLTVLALLVTFQAESNAQSITADDVTGTVTDPTGATIPGAM